MLPTIPNKFGSVLSTWLQKDEQVNTAVADDMAGEQSDATSVPGDSNADSSHADSDEPEAAKEARRNDRNKRKFTPTAPRQGDPNELTRIPSRWNDQWEVGNFALMAGNWGLRSTVGGKRPHSVRRYAHDRQITKSPAQVIVLAEASPAIEELLRRPRSHGTEADTGLERRGSAEHWVVRGNENSAILIAARKDVTTNLNMLDYEVSDDHPYVERGTGKQARSRVLVCQVLFKQNIGHIGKDIVVAGVHGHNRTMKFEWPEVFHKFWDGLARKIREFNVKFLAGDFNMAFTEVPNQLWSRGIKSDCCAWYPWRHDTKTVHQSSLGFDSCGIFYIGGTVEVALPWSLARIGELTAVADDLKSSSLDVYHGQNHPGQHWSAYRTKKNDPEHEKCLTKRLEDLLTPSTAVAELHAREKREGTWYCPYLRIKQKELDRNEWLVNDVIHNGAHFPLCVWTHNASARSAERAKARAKKTRAHKHAKGKGNGKGKAKGDCGKSKSKGGTPADVFATDVRYARTGLDRMFKGDYFATDFKGSAASSSSAWWPQDRTGPYWE